MNEMTKTMLEDVSLWPLECLPVKREGWMEDDSNLGSIIREEPLTVRLGNMYNPSITKLVYTSLDNLIDDGWEVD